MLPVYVGLTAAAGAVSSPDTSAPTNPPLNVSAYSVGNRGILTGVQWTNGDTDANTEIGRSDSNAVEPVGIFENDFVFGNVAPGETSFNTQDERNCYWWVRHRKNAQYSVWVLGGCSPGADGGTGSGGDNTGTTGGTDSGPTTDEEDERNREPIN